MFKMLATVPASGGPEDHRAGYVQFRHTVAPTGWLSLVLDLKSVLIAAEQVGQALPPKGEAPAIAECPMSFLSY